MILPLDQLGGSMTGGNGKDRNEDKPPEDDNTTNPPPGGGGDTP